MALIEIGSNKQLFVNDYLIESMTNARQVMNPAEKVTHNPVIYQDRPWEGRTLPQSIDWEMAKIWRINRDDICHFG